MPGSVALICLFLFSFSLQSVTSANILEFLQNLPSKMWEGILTTWSSLKENTMMGVIEPKKQDKTYVFSTTMIANDFVKVSGRKGPNVKGYKGDYKPVRKIYLEQEEKSSNPKRMLTIPYLKHPDTQYAFQLKSAPSRSYEPSSVSTESTRRFESKMPPPSQLQAVTQDNNAIIDEADVIIKFDNFHIFINTSTRLVNKNKLH